MSSYQEVVEKDLQLLWSIQEYCQRTPSVHNLFSRIVSKNPAKDVVLVLWLFFCYGLVEIGMEHFWVASINITVALGNAQHNNLPLSVSGADGELISSVCIAVSSVARKIIEAKRPVEYDSRLQPATDTSAESYG